MSLRPVTIGKGEVLSRGDDVAILASGTTVASATEAAQGLAPHVSATVVNMHTVKPFDAALVRELASSHRAILTVENHSVIGGLGAATAEVLATSGISVPFAMLGVQDVFAEGGSSGYLRKAYGFDAEAIAVGAQALLK